MDLQNSQRYSNGVLQSSLFHDNSYSMSIHSARDSYHPHPPELMHSPSDPYIQHSPVVFYNPYASDHLDKALFLENRMRIQQNIINKHKTEVNKSLIRERDALQHEKVASKHQSTNDLNKKSYSSMFSKQNNKSYKSGGLKQNASDVEDVWMPKGMSTDSYGNIVDYPMPETLDTSRGKAKYALVRLNSTGHIDIPQMYVESGHPLNMSTSYNTQTNDPKQLSVKQKSYNKHSTDPNNFIGSENRTILEKVNGIQNDSNETEPYVQNKQENNGEKNTKLPEKRFQKKSSKITLDDLNLQKETIHPLMSRKSKQSMKNQNKADDTEELNIQYLEQKSEYKERRASRDTNQTYSRKSSIINSRQSSQNGGKGSYTETPLSFVTTDSFNNVTSETKRSRSKKSRKQKTSNDEDIRQTNISPRINVDNQSLVKKRETRRASNTQSEVVKPEITTPTRKSQKTIKADDKLNTDRSGNSRDSQQEEKPQAKKNHKNSQQEDKPQAKKNHKNSKTDDKKKEPNVKSTSSSEQQKPTSNNDVIESTKPTIVKQNKNKKNIEQKNKYVTRNKNLRKTDSFKMMGNSSHFFGYCSVPEEIGQTKIPKSILKKSTVKPERPDTA